jgi:hypothetical protein
MSIDEPDAALRIVEAGRRRVHRRLHDAFARQIAGHRDLGDVDPDMLERLVNDGADRAGASLWRIALAEGAADEFGIGVAEALTHPAVNAAEQLLDPPAEPLPPPADAGLPAETLRQDLEPDLAEPVPASWEDGTASEPGAVEPDPWAAPEAQVQALGAAEPEPAPEPELVPEPESVPEPELVPEAESAPAPLAEPAPADPAPAPSAIRVAAVHTGGIESLKEGEKDLELRFSDAGLDVIKASTGIAIGRLEWREVTSVELAGPRRGLRRRAPALDVRTARGQATFDLPGLTEDETSEHLEPMLERLRAAGALASG